MFKLHEKVVCIKEFDEPGNQPQINEMVVIDGFEIMDNELYLIINGYEIDTDGIPQAFIFYKFRKLDYQFAEDLLNKISLEVSRESNPV